MAPGMTGTIAAFAFALPVGAICGIVPGLAALVAADRFGRSCPGSLAMPLALQAVRLLPLLDRAVALRSAFLDGGLRRAPSLRLLGVIRIERARAQERRDVIRMAGLPVMGDATEVVTRPAETALLQAVVPVLVPTALMITHPPLQSKPLAFAVFRKSDALERTCSKTFVVVHGGDVEATNHCVPIAKEAPRALGPGRVRPLTSPAPAAWPAAPQGGPLRQIRDGVFSALEGVRIAALFLMEGRQVGRTP